MRGLPVALLSWGVRSVELLGAALQQRKSGSLPWPIDPSPACHRIGVPTPWQSCKERLSHPLYSWSSPRDVISPPEGLSGWIPDGLQDCHAGANFSSVALAPGISGPCHHLTWCLFASLHSELRPLPDPSSDWEGQLWQGKEESLRMGQWRVGTYGTTEPHRLAPFLLREASPITGAKSSGLSGKKQGLWPFWGRQCHPPPTFRQGLLAQLRTESGLVTL